MWKLRLNMTHLEVVQQVGVENIVQFITDNDASYKATEKKL